MVRENNFQRKKKTPQNLSKTFIIYPATSLHILLQKQGDRISFGKSNGDIGLISYYDFV